MFWTSINKKFQHLTRIVLSYLTYESNLYSPLNLIKYIILFSTMLIFTSLI